MNEWRQTGSHLYNRTAPMFATKLVKPALVALALAVGGCATVKHMAVNQVGDAMATGGTTFAQDNDPELIREAAPSNLKMMEALLDESPQHAGLLLALTKGFTQYAYAFVQEDADEAEAGNLTVAEAGRARAKNLYLRAKGYGLRGLDVAHPGFSAVLTKDPAQAANELTVDDVPLAYWTSVAWASAIALGKDDADLLAQIPQMEALIDRAAALDESWNLGAIHTFLITYEMARQGVGGDAAARAKTQFDRAIELSHGWLAAPFVAYAEAVTVPKQNAAAFKEALDKAIAINPDDHPDYRLENLIMQRRARWLESQTDELFLLPAKPTKE